MTSSSVSLRDGKKANLQFVGLQCAFWLAFFCQNGYAFVFLEERGFSKTQIGAFLTLQAIASIIAQPLFSSFAEKHRRIPLKRIIALQVLISIGAMIGLSFLQSSAIFAAVIFLLFGASFHATFSLVNAIGMQLGNAGYGVNYGVARGFGSFSFAVAGIVVGRLVLILGVHVIIPAFILCAAAMIVFTLFMITPPPLPDEIPKAVSVRKAYLSGAFEFIRTHRAFTGLGIATCFLMASHACLNTFIPDIVGSVGGNTADQGITRSIAAFVELPIMVAGGFLISRFKIHRILIFSSIFFFVKSVATIFAGSLGLLFAVQILQIPAYGLFFPVSVLFANMSTREGERVRAQAILNVLGMGVGYLIGNMVGGPLLDRFPTISVLLASTVFAVLGSAVMIGTLAGSKDYSPSPPPINDSGSSSPSVNTLQESSVS